MSVGALAGAGLAGLALLAGCQLVLDFSADLEAQTDAGAPDAGAAPDAASLCDKFEPNESLEQTIDVEPGAFQGSICPAGDQDFYSFTLDGTQDLEIILTFAAGANDLELELYDQLSGARLTLSTGGDGDEQIVHSAAQGNRLVAATYVMRVYGRTPTVGNDYQLMWRRGPLAAPALR